MSTNKHLQAAGYSIASNIFVQVLSRGFTFVLGAITLKYLQSSALLGIINVRLALLYSTLQFLSREPFRRACLGETVKSEIKSWQKIVNTIWMGFILSMLLSFPLAYIWQLNSPSDEDLAGTSTHDYQTAVVIICLAVIVEMMAESCFIYAQAKAIIEHNPKVEVVLVTTKSILVAAITVLEGNRYKAGESSDILTKIATCNLIASSVSVIYSYSRLYRTHNLPLNKFLPAVPTTQINKTDQGVYKYLDKNSLKLSLGFVSQTFLKQLLTEGERYVMTFFNVISLSEQGIYDVVNNLGSLAARLLFKPIEDSAYTLFSQTVSRTEILDIRKFYRVQENLMFLIKSMLLLGLTILTLGYNYVPLMVLYGGEKLNNPLAFHLMRWHLFYTPLLAVNGVTECFTFATMNPPEIRSHNLKMILYSFVFLIVIYFTLSSLGSACFIFANSVIMVLRIFMSYRFIKAYFAKHGYQLNLEDTFPSPTTMVSLSGLFGLLSLALYYLAPVSVLGILLGGWCLVFIVHVIMCHEEALLSFLTKLFKLRKH